MDPAGNAYMAGNTDTIDLPTTPGALMPSGLGAFAMKINAAGTAIAWLTYIGSGSYSTITPFITSENTATAIAADAAGNAYVVGSTIDPNFPATAGAYQTALGNLPPGNPPQTPTDGFVVKLNGGGGALWATYLGGQGADRANSVAVDSSGNAWVSGAPASAAAALRHGASHVDAVEIDPLISTVGTRLHPEHPYSSPKVHLITNDARNYLRKCQDKYDVIIFGLLDSHTEFSGYSNMRVDNYVYTEESFRDARRLLNKDGILV